jgi:general secretion pathway protein H
MSSAENTAGFTLVEMTAVMLIVALMATLGVAMTRGSGRPQLKAVALQTAALLRRERVGAILTGHERRVVLDSRRRRLIGDGGDVVAVPGDITLEVLSAREQEAVLLTVVRFHPDGASTGAFMRLSREGAHYEIRVNWFTGGVAVLP